MPDAFSGIFFTVPFWFINARSANSYQIRKHKNIKCQRKHFALTITKTER